MIGNTIAGPLATGQVNAKVEATTANSAACVSCSAAPASGGQGATIVTTNERTGAASKNENSISVASQRILTEVNNNTTTNSVNLGGNTGGNKNAFNTVSHGITTGNIFASVSLNTTTKTTLILPPKPGVATPPGNNVNVPSTPSTPGTVPGLGGGEAIITRAIIAPRRVGPSNMFFPAGATLLPTIITLLVAAIGSAIALRAQSYGRVHA